MNAAFQRSIHTNPDLIFAKRNGPEQPYIVYGRWTNMSYPPLQTGSYPAYDPKWNGTAINGTTKASVATVKSTVLATSTANTASAKVTAAATSIVQPVARTTTADTATATVRTSGAEQMRAGIAAMIAVLLAVLML